MKAKRSKLAGTIAARTLKGSANKKYLREIAAYLLENGMIGDLDSVLRDVQNDWAEAGYLEVIAESAHPLTASLKAEITRRAKAIYPNVKRVVITEEPNPEVVGGVRLSLPGKQLDLSVEAKLNRFKQLTVSGKE